MPATPEYIIASATLIDGEQMFWSNELGWTTREAATLFTWAERYGTADTPAVSLPFTWIGDTSVAGVWCRPLTLKE